MKLRIIAAAGLLALGAWPASAQPVGPLAATTNAIDGCHPCAGLVLSGNTLYGTTSEGGDGHWYCDCGTVFKVNTDGKHFGVLHRFTLYSHPTGTNSDGGNPQAGLVLSGHTLYGTACKGGCAGGGTVFKVNTDGSGFAVLHSFTAAGPANHDGARPMARLALSGKTLYGTAQFGGNAGGRGTVFKLNTDGTGFTTLHAFTELAGRFLTNWDGAFPEAELLVSGNTLFGTACAGGPGGLGTVFTLKRDGTGFTVLHSFTRAPYKKGQATNDDRGWPKTGLALSGKTLYGTAQESGGNAGRGAVFKLKTDGTGFAVLHSFTAHGDTSPGDGADPEGLTLSSNTLYGIASANGRRGWGTLFRVNADGTGFDILHSFDGGDGRSPRGSLVLSGDTLYGSANFGGRGEGGTVFKVRTDGTGFTVLHNFIAERSPIVPD